MSTVHKNVKITDCGLYRSTSYPYLGATPDGMMTCSCCTGSYVIEIKCPFKCSKNTTVELAKTDPEFCMEFTAEGRYQLKRTHAYFYQVQLQMLLTNSSSCYFYVHGNSVSLCELVHIDIPFLEREVDKARKFFIFGILPELLGKWYSRSNISHPNIQNRIENESEQSICICRESRESELIHCCDKSCMIKNFHTICLGIESVPKGKWFCPYCRNKKSRKPSKGKENKN